MLEDAPDAVVGEPDAASLRPRQFSGDASRSEAGVAEGEGHDALLDERTGGVGHARLAALAGPQQLEAVALGLGLPSRTSAGSSRSIRSSTVKATPLRAAGGTSWEEGDARSALRLRHKVWAPAPGRWGSRTSRALPDRGLQVRPRLEQLVEEWSERTTAKQRITGRRLQRALREEGYEVGITLVLEYLREWRRRRAEVYVPLVHRPGESAQTDFFEVSVELSGERRKAWLFLMRRCTRGGTSSGSTSARTSSPSSTATCGPSPTSGVPRRTVYDNLAAAVGGGMTSASRRSPATTASSPASRAPARGTTRAAWSPAAGLRCSRRPPRRLECRSSDRSRCRGGRPPGAAAGLGALRQRAAGAAPPAGSGVRGTAAAAGLGQPQRAASRAPGTRCRSAGALGHGLRR